MRNNIKVFNVHNVTKIFNKEKGSKSFVFEAGEQQLGYNWEKNIANSTEFKCDNRKKMFLLKICSCMKNLIRAENVRVESEMKTSGLPVGICASKKIFHKNKNWKVFVKQNENTVNNLILINHSNYFLSVLMQGLICRLIQPLQIFGIKIVLNFRPFQQTY